MLVCTNGCHKGNVALFLNSVSDQTVYYEHNCTDATINCCPINVSNDVSVQFNSVKFNFIFIASILVQIVSRHFSETQSTYLL